MVPPTRTSHMRPFTIISGVGGYARGLRTDGRVVCWGMNAPRTVAPEDRTDRHPPFPDTFIEGIRDEVELHCGINDGCRVRLRNGTVWCWGDVLMPLERRPGTWTSRNPVQATGIDRAMQTSSVGASVCALRDDETVRCIRYGAAECPLTRSGAVSVLYTGGLVCVLRRDGTVWCWGRLEDDEHPCAGPRQIGRIRRARAHARRARYGARSVTTRMRWLYVSAM